MRELFKILTIFCLLFFVAVTPAFSKNNIKMLSHISENFNPVDFPNEINFKTIKKITVLEDITIPQRSIVTAEIIQTQKERRWHKSGYILCKVKYFVTEYDEKLIDISDRNLYLIIRKYEPVDKKEVAIIATEIILTQGASFFAPGVDILYFFTKGAIQRKKHYNWFKAGVHNAYENSICWFWLKGKPIELMQNEKIQIKDIKEEKVYKLKEQIEKRKEKQAIKDENNRIKKEFKQEKTNIKKYAKTHNGKIIEGPSIITNLIEQEVTPAQIPYDEFFVINNEL